MRTRTLRARLACAAFTLLACSLQGCAHGSDDTGGGTATGSMSGATGPQYTQANANRQGPPPGGGKNAPAPDVAPTGGLTNAPRSGE